ncbi:putative uncharacterized protein BRD3OS [Cheilinus undulatus]|uniref:putative uncharacterized protein BRD3OS n=1 Tax=Cheilinus undulatus TaxID=241271 RepID=UPI001BD24385|nr:putative uncharacterized protein BRD3OS [Cheilinus undulatus]XP_041643916.1 putative uncharacterized protein BRD3OS [Cheilinus undulatus]XP_041643917.1 putative uncharacterized protein BRD3OS [Cheilinus undulatus]
MSDPDPAAVEERTAAGRCPGPARPPLAEKALSEAFARLRYRDTSLLIWQQQQQDLLTAPPSNYLSRSQSAWYSSFGNQAVVVRNKRDLEDTEGRSRICSVM